MRLTEGLIGIITPNALEGSCGAFPLVEKEAIGAAAVERFAGDGIDCCAVDADAPVVTPLAAAVEFRSSARSRIPERETWLQR